MQRHIPYRQVVTVEYEEEIENNVEHTHPHIHNAGKQSVTAAPQHRSRQETYLEQRKRQTEYQEI